MKVTIMFHYVLNNLLATWVEFFVLWIFRAKNMIFSHWKKKCIGISFRHEIETICFLETKKKILAFILVLKCKYPPYYVH